MSREAHVRIWERVGVRFPCATRHIVTDTCGLLVGAEVHPADVQDRDGAVLVIEAIHQLFPWLRHLFADSVYNGPNLREASGPSRSSNAPLTLLAFNCCHAAGWSNEPSRGSIETAAWQRISRLRSRAPRLGFTSPRYSSLSGGWLDQYKILYLHYNFPIKIQTLTIRKIAASLSGCSSHNEVSAASMSTAKRS